jgi:outer membrane protein assembly factor BamA
MTVAVGDAADPEQLRRSAQYIKDLGLFADVAIDTQPVEGGVRLQVTVDERWYLLPYPRYSVNVEGQSSVGADLRWANVGGRNHSLRLSYARTERKLQGRGDDTGYSAGYVAPYLFGSPYRLSLSAGHSTSPVEGEVPHEERFDDASIFVSRSFPEPGGARSQGYGAGLGLAWQRQDREGEGVPAPYGRATALSTSVSYRNLRNRIYSEEGLSWSIGGSFARAGVLSDYSYQSVEARLRRDLQVGETPHQTLHWGLSAGAYSNGPQEIEAYSFGGSSVFRGYSTNSLPGNAYWYGFAEIFRPVIWPWLRAGSILEVGKVFASTQDAHLRSAEASLGFGLRVRFVRFVALEVEIGYAFPLTGGEGKLFGSRV